MVADQVTMLITIAIINTRDSGLALVSSESLKQSLNPLTIGAAVASHYSSFIYAEDFTIKH